MSIQRIYQQDGRFLLLPVSNLITPLEEREEFFNRLTLLKITPDCKKEIREILIKPRKLPFLLKNVNGITPQGLVYNDVYFYGNINTELLQVVNKIRANYGFDVINK